MPTTIDMQRRRFELMAAEHAVLIGARIREARVAAHLTQNELAEKIPGKSDGTQVSKWERGEHRVSDDTLKHIARILKHDVPWFHTTAPNKAETPDLAQIAGESQLDRIERKLDEIRVFMDELSVEGIQAAVQQALPRESSRRVAAGRSRRAS